MGSKIKDNKMIAPKEVRYEIGEKNDALKKWIGEYPGLRRRNVLPGVVATKSINTDAHAAAQARRRSSWSAPAAR